MLNLITRLALTVALAMLAVIATVVPAHADPADLSGPCAPYEGCLIWDGSQIYADVEHAPEVFTDDLFAAGFYGIPFDGPGGVEIERLYAPRVLDAERAPEWVVDALRSAGYYGDPRDRCECLYAPTRG